MPTAPMASVPTAASIDVGMVMPMRLPLAQQLMPPLPMNVPPQPAGVPLLAVPQPGGVQPVAAQPVAAQPVAAQPMPQQPGLPPGLLLGLLPAPFPPAVPPVVSPELPLAVHDSSQWEELLQQPLIGHLPESRPRGGRSGAGSSSSEAASSSRTDTPVDAGGAAATASAAAKAAAVAEVAQEAGEATGMVEEAGEAAQEAGEAAEEEGPHAVPSGAESDMYGRLFDDQLDFFLQLQMLAEDVGSAPAMAPSGGAPSPPTSPPPLGWPRAGQVPAERGAAAQQLAPAEETPTPPGLFGMMTRWVQRMVQHSATSLRPAPKHGADRQMVNFQTLLLVLTCATSCAISSPLSNYFGEPADAEIWPTWLRSLLLALFGGNVVALRVLGVDMFSRLWISTLVLPPMVCVPYFTLVATTDDFLAFRRVQDEGIKRATNAMLFLAAGCTHAAFPRSVGWKLRYAGIWFGAALVSNATLSLRHGLGTSMIEYDVQCLFIPFMTGALATSSSVQWAAMMLDTELPVFDPVAAAPMARGAAVRWGR